MNKLLYKELYVKFDSEIPRVKSKMPQNENFDFFYIANDKRERLAWKLLIYKNGVEICSGVKTILSRG